MAKAITHCPNCGATVSQFAAGCAICGENLSAARQRLERRREALQSVARFERPAWFPRITGADAVLGGLLLIIAFFSPVIGGPIAALFAYFAHQKGDLVQRNLAVAAVAVALIVLILVSFLPERSYKLLPWIDLSGPLPTN
jgi:hypothetical protein